MSVSLIGLLSSNNRAALLSLFICLFIAALKENYNFNFIAHGYFPPPKTPFNFNLASQKKTIREKSIKLVKNAVNVCADINAPIFTFHAGFTVDPPKLGKPFPKNKKFDREKAISRYYESIDELIDFTKNFDVNSG